MKKQHTAVIAFAALFAAGSVFVRSAYSGKLLLMLPPILAKKKPTRTILNDTGITWSGNYPSGNNTTCVSSGGNMVTAQDCYNGWDATNYDYRDGYAGFSYTKLDSDGKPLADQNADYASGTWACVQDNITGLIWEIKTDDGGLHDKDDTYWWHNTDGTTNGGAAGADGAANNTCFGWSSGNAATYCNTQAYVNRVNAAGLCGANDWRIPTLKELESIVNYGRSNPAIDRDYFPNAVSSHVWSGAPDVYSSAGAFYVNFAYGNSAAHYRESAYAVRLVRGGR